MYGIFTYMWLIANDKSYGSVMGIIKVPVQPEVAEVWFFRHYGEGLLAEK